MAGFTAKSRESPRAARLPDGSDAPSEQAIAVAPSAKEAEGVIEAIEVQRLPRQPDGLGPFQRDPPVLRRRPRHPGQVQNSTGSS
jgi:hypothetical protein